VSSVSIRASSFFLVLATVDKYVAIRWPFKHIQYFTRARAKLVASLLWPLLLLVTSTIVYFANVWENVVVVKYCEPIYLMNTMWCVIVSFLLDFGTFPLLIVLNAHIFVIVQRRGTLSAVPEAANSNVARKNSTNSVSARAWKVISLVVATYIICRLPLTMIMFTGFLYMAQGKDTGDLEQALPYAIIASMMNSAMNPIIYYKTMPSIRAAFKKVLCC
jgi:hypothetical protein